MADIMHLDVGFNESDLINVRTKLSQGWKESMQIYRCYSVHDIIFSTIFAGFSQKKVIRNIINKQNKEQH